MKPTKRGYHTDSSCVIRESKHICVCFLDPAKFLPGQIFVQVLLESQLDLSTTAWVLVRVSRRWKEAIENHLCKRWRAVDVYHPFLWSDGPPLAGGLIPPMDHILKEWGRQGWLGLLQWARGLGFPLLHEWSQERYGRPTLLLEACEGGHKSLIEWWLPEAKSAIPRQKAYEGACRTDNVSTLHWLVLAKKLNPDGYIPMDKNPASRGDLETCKWLAKQCRFNGWLTAAGRNDHRLILEWAISEGHGLDYLVTSTVSTSGSLSTGQRCCRGRAA